MILRNSSVGAVRNAQPASKRLLRRFWLLTLVALAALGACRSKPRAAAVASWEIAGCEWLDGGHRCGLTPSSHRVMVWSPDNQVLRVTVDDVAKTWSAQRDVDRGVVYELDVPVEAQRLLVSASTQPTRQRELHLHAITEPAELARARALRAKGSPAAARASLEARWPDGVARPARVESLLARLTLDEGKLQLATDQLEACLTRALQEQRVTGAFTEASALSYVLVSSLRQDARARRVLDRVEPLSHVDPAGRARSSYGRGVLALETGDLGVALTLLHDAATQFGRWNMREHERNANDKLSQTLALLGRHDDAVATQEKLLAHLENAGPCTRVDSFETMFWIIMLQAPAPGSERAAQAELALHEVQAGLAGCPMPRKQRNHVVNVALFALQQADTTRAAAAVEQLEHMTEGRDTQLDTWQAELRGRLDLALGQPTRAKAAFARALALGRVSGLWENEFLAGLGLGRAERALGHRESALAAFTDADSVLDTLLNGVPPSIGAASFLSEREAASRAALDLLVVLGRNEQALQLARRVRARLTRASARDLSWSPSDSELRERRERAVERYRQLRAATEARALDAWKYATSQLAQQQVDLLAERAAAQAALNEAWSLSSQSAVSAPQTLSRLAEGEALLAYARADNGWIGLCDDAHAVSIARIVLAESPELTLGEQLFEPFAAQLLHARRVRVIATDELASRNLHMLPFRGTPLSARLPVAYGTDSVGVRTQPTQEGPLLIVSDPTGELSAAVTDMHAAQAALSDRALVALRGAQASRARVLAELNTSSAFHFAGHGFVAADGLDAGLRLADGALTVGDVLTLPRVPAFVVLAACDGAAVPSVGLTAAMSVAQAFSARGATTVIAATQTVRDSAAAQLMSEFYRALAGDSLHDPVRALAQAQQRMLVLDNFSDWQSFRALVP